MVFEEVGGRTTAVVPSVQKKLSAAATGSSRRNQRSDSADGLEETDSKVSAKVSRKRGAAEAVESLSALPQVPVEVVSDPRSGMNTADVQPATGRRRRRGQ